MSIDTFQLLGLHGEVIVGVVGGGVGITVTAVLRQVLAVSVRKGGESGHHKRKCIQRNGDDATQHLYVIFNITS